LNYSFRNCTVENAEAALNELLIGAVIGKFGVDYFEKGSIL